MIAKNWLEVKFLKFQWLKFLESFSQIVCYFSVIDKSFENGLKLVGINKIQGLFNQKVVIY